MFLLAEQVQPITQVLILHLILEERLLEFVCLLLMPQQVFADAVVTLQNFLDHGHRADQLVLIVAFVKGVLNALETTCGH